MKSNLLMVAIALSSMSAIAAELGDAAGDGGFFVNGNFGRSDLNKQGIYNDNDSAYSVNVGYRWAISPAVAVGLEGGYTDLGSFHVLRYADPLGTLHLPQASVDGWSLGVNARFNLSPSWYLSMRGGLFRADAEGLHFGSGAQLINTKATSTSDYAGAGVGYNLSSNFSLGFDYDFYKTDKDGLRLQPNMISVSAEYRFR